MAISHAKRFWRHLVTDHLSVRRAFPRVALERIEQAIAAGERTHRGQLCFAVEGSLHPMHVLRRLTPRERALEVFGLLRVWDTEENSGVLIYLLLADRDVEIVADRGVHRAAGAAAWRAVSTHMESAFARGEFADGAVRGIEEISALLARHFPRTQPGGNELPDKAVVL
ncbi:MAG: TPM domain-containing protein [Betaproteobacteria bacterium]|nr:TPM domain-containing protein [Betaproteobacteria bacterium]MDE2208397.1 TPM domain-containing protein [Betaproteobacteria bacterium]MDE2359834.1 TPM domain-containing protein [Betaproteobacteria bacterium]